MVKTVNFVDEKRKHACVTLDQVITWASQQEINLEYPYHKAYCSSRLHDNVRM